ncbi:MAG: MFS transporter [Alicyclobacillus shizuokensis]|nr:MFS transporter [Alicyclobacillus shizuokensis]
MSFVTVPREHINLLTRLDRVPMGRSLWVIVILLALTWIIEGFDTNIVSPAVVMLTPLWHLTSSQTGVVATIGALGVVIGLIPAGRLADIMGRRTILCWGIGVFCLATFAAGFAQNFSRFVVLRFIAGLAEGAVFPVPYLMLSELVNRRRRAVAVGWALLGLSLGNTFPALATRFALASYGTDEAWRVPLIIGGIPILIIPALLIWVPESPRYLLRRGAVEQVRKIVLKFEQQASVAPDDSVYDEALALALTNTPSNKGQVRKLFRSPYLGRSLVAYAQLLSAFIGFYLFAAYGPTILKLLGATTENAFLYSAIGGFISGIGNLLQGMLAERYGRRPVMAGYVALQVIGLVLLSLHVSVWILAGAFVVYSFGGGNFALGKLYVAEQYPTSLRSTGASTGETLTRFLAGVVLAYFIPTLMTSWGPTVLFSVLGALMLVLVLPMVLYGQETARVSVDITGAEIGAQARTE